MKPGWGFPPDGDPGGGAIGGNTIDGSYRGRTVPEWMDPQNVHGPLTILRLQPVDPAVLPKNPTVVSLSVTQCCGLIEGAFPEKRGTRYALKVRRPEQVEQLKAMKELYDHTPICIDEHPIHNNVKCVIHNYEVVDLSEAEVKDILAWQGVSSVKRITRKGDGENRINTPMLILTVTGTAIPQHVYLGYIRVETRPYYPAPMQCYKCWEFGHTKLRCAKNEICGTCAGDHEVVRGVSCRLTPHCPKCKSYEHAASSKKCPVYVAENEIARMRVDQGLTYEAAKKIYERKHTSSQSGNASNSGVNQEILKRLAEMDERLNRKDKEMEEQKEEWNRKLQDQQVITDRLQHDLNMYKNLYRTTKTQLNEVTHKYNELLKETGRAVQSVGLPASQVAEDSCRSSKPNSKDSKQQQKQNKNRKSRSRSRSRDHKKNEKPRSRSVKRPGSPIDPNSLKIRSTEVSDNRHRPPDFPHNPSDDDDPAMQT